MQFAPTNPVPLFPLPGFVLFPRTVAPLHVFERRHRAMIQDAVRRDRLIAVALLKPGWEGEYYGTPDFHPIGCLGRLQEVVWLPDDCYDIKVEGVGRVRVSRVVNEFPYRTVKVDPVPQEPLPESDPLVELERRALLDAWRGAEGISLTALPDPHGSLEAVVNTLCMTLPLDAEDKRTLLEMDSVLERSRHIREALEQVRRTGGPEGAAEGEN